MSGLLALLHVQKDALHFGADHSHKVNKINPRISQSQAAGTTKDICSQSARLPTSSS
uniref:IP17341p n=1 Tax=Drosophila melanogaster TaxID=7227 RepID=A1A704_DROME|nr:IP17341p [Drosophila melanogaster]